MSGCSATAVSSSDEVGGGDGDQLTRFVELAAVHGADRHRTRAYHPPRRDERDLARGVLGFEYLVCRHAGCSDLAGVVLHRSARSARGLAEWHEARTGAL